MAKKGKVKISKVKRNNQTTNKMRKKGQLKLQRHRTRIQKQKQPTQQPEIQYSSESEPESGDEFGDMLDDEEQQYLMSRLAKQPQLLANVPENEKPATKSRKRKREKKEKFPKQSQQQGSDSGAETDGLSDSDLEEKYEKDLSDRPPKRMRPLLPIKTKQGLEEREIECEDTESEEDEKPQPLKSKEIPETEEQSDSDSGMEGTEEETTPEGDEKVVTAVELLAARRDKLQHEKLRIGALCSSLLESPEKKLKNLFPILYLMEERLKDGTLNLHSIRKLATVSVCEVFKDILPEYMIRHQDYSNVKLKKDTLALYKHEKELLEFYKRYLQRLEKAAGMLRQKKGDTRKLDESSLSLALVSLRCMCSLLVAKPQFNYATNIAQSVVPHLDSKHAAARSMVTESCKQVFIDDNKGDITLTVVRLINQLVKRRNERLHPSALDCLLALKIRDIDMDAEAEVKNKKKQEEKHKKRIVNLSKKEKKRAKKLKEVERELLETEAQESDLSRRKQLTEVTRVVFHIYFRLLKTAPRSQLLSAALDGLAKFTHVINLEYYSDLVGILARLVKDEELSPRSRLQCVRGVLRVLRGAGDALAVDPATFHAQLYADMPRVHAGRTQEDARIVVECVGELASRGRRVSCGVLAALAKRTASLACTLQHHAALACLAQLAQLVQQNKSVSALLEVDGESSGSGRYDPLVTSPEHCNAHATHLYELCALARHYHPLVRRLAADVTRGELPQELHKMSPIQIHDAYDGSQMAFKPAIPPPKRIDNQNKKITNTHMWTQPSLKELCNTVEDRVQLIITNNNNIIKNNR